MKPKDHQEKQLELEQAFKKNQMNPQKSKGKAPSIMSQYQLVEMGGMLFDPIKQDQKNEINSPSVDSYAQQVNSSNQIPVELQQAQQAVQQAQQHLLDENQQLQQALYELHQAQEKVKQCQNQVQQTQQDVQTTQATANSIVNKLK